MHSVYRNAAFCIAATVAIDGTVGLFHDRNAQSLEPFQLDLVWRTNEKKLAQAPIATKCSFAWPDAYTRIDCAPLNQRSWVAQERYLSRRILHFTRKLVFWECPDGITCETHTEELPGWLQSGNNFDNLYSLKTVVNDIQPSNEFRFPDLPDDYPDHPDEVYWFWCKFRALYTSFQLTKDADILIALSGIAQDVSERLNDDMVAGMWRRRLVEDICWCIKINPNKPWRPMVWRAPSWSWASSRQIVKASRLGYDLNTDVTQMCNIVDVRLETDAMGDMVKGTVVLKGRLIPWTKRLPNLEEQIGDGVSTPPVLKIILDEPLDSDNSERECYFLVLQSHQQRGHEQPIAEGIIIAPCETAFKLQEQYRRVGHFRDFGTEVLNLFHAQEECVIDIM